MSTPTPGQGPVSYPDSQPYAVYPPLDHTADQPPRAPRPQAPKKGLGAGAIFGLVAGAGLLAITAGTIGGGVGYLVARETLPVATTTASTTSESVAAGDALPSVIPGSIADIAATVQPAVVQLNVTGADGEGTGSGFVISQDGYIITNNHVAGGAGKDGSIEVLFSDGAKMTGTLVGASPDYDIAVVKVNGTALTSVPLGRSADLRVGDSVIAVGSPLGLSGTVTTGIVSALDRPVTAGDGGADTSFINAIQTDAAINPGNSGGPLLNGNGEVIGVNSAIATMGDAAGNPSGSIGLGFSIPIDTAKRIADEIVANGSAVTPVLGVQLDMQFSGPGALVDNVTPGSGAEKAGLQPGDVITQVDGKTIGDPTELIVKVRSYAPGDSVELTVQRNGQTQPATVVLSSNAPNQEG